MRTNGVVRAHLAGADGGAPGIEGADPCPRCFTRPTRTADEPPHSRLATDVQEATA